MHSNFNDLKTKTMDKEFKNAEEYYRQTRMVETRNWSLQMALNFADEYHQAKLKLLGITNVSQQRELLKAFLQYVNCSGTNSKVSFDLLDKYLNSL
ncbi:MAG: hypothetical protein V3S79_00760 [Candidatus Thermoplasmatota archaeon]